MTDDFTGTAPLRVDARGRLMFTSESRQLITQELAEAFQAGAKWHKDWVSGKALGGMEIGDGDFSQPALAYASEAARLSVGEK